MTVPPPRSLLPVFIGVALTVVLLAGLGYLAQLRRNAQPSTPTVFIISPTSAPVDSPMTIRFTSTQPLELTKNGWVAGRWHLHARINNVEYMPAAHEVVASDSTYTWTLPPVRRGPITLRLGWANQHHREVAAGSSDVVRTTVR